MAKYWKEVVSIVLTILIILGLYLLTQKFNTLRVENARYAESQKTLLAGIKEYQTKDSLKAVEIGVLNMRISEYEYFRSKDASMIESLRTKNRELQNITSMQSEMLANITAPVVDTVVVYLDNTGGVTKDTLQRVDYHDAWLDFTGTIKNGNMSTDIAMRDSLLIVESVTYKRFLGFLWKTKRIKDRKIDAVSKNPYNHIQSLERVQIVK